MGSGGESTALVAFRPVSGDETVQHTLQKIRCLNLLYRAEQRYSKTFNIYLADRRGREKIGGCSREAFLPDPCSEKLQQATRI